MSKLLILISGKQGSGKSSTARNLKDFFEFNSISRLKVYQTKFAKVIYEMHDSIRQIGGKYGIPMERKMGDLLQFLGTEFGRKKFGQDVWVKSAANDLLKKEKDYDIFIIDDLRFHNEADIKKYLPEWNVFKVRLNSADNIRRERCDGWRDDTSHPSETSLDDYEEFDLKVNTDVCGELEVVDLILKAIHKGVT